jgi:hypothetical protein
MVQTDDLVIRGPDVLKEGECYFQVVYSMNDDDGRYPCIETYVYVFSCGPLPDGRRRPDSSSWTVTSSAACSTFPDWPKP